MDGSKIDKDISGKMLHCKPSQPPRLKSKPSVLSPYIISYHKLKLMILSSHMRGTKEIYHFFVRGGECT